MDRLLRTRAFRERFYSVLQRGPVSLSICVPYIGKIPGFGSVFHFATYFSNRGGQRFRLITGPPGSGRSRLSPELATKLAALDFLDLLIRSSPVLHAKLYHVQFASGAGIGYIGSANFTKGGLQDNDEVMAEIGKTDEERQVLAEIERLSGHGAIPFRAWRQQRVMRSDNV